MNKHTLTKEETTAMLVGYMYEAQKKWSADFNRVEARCKKENINPEDFWNAYDQHVKAQKAAAAAQQPSPALEPAAPQTGGDTATGQPQSTSTAGPAFHPPSLATTDKAA